VHLTQIWEERLYALKSIAYALLMDSSAVEDVLQETFKKVLEKERKFSDKHEAANYLRRAVINNSIDAVRRRQRNFKRFKNREDYRYPNEMVDQNSDDPLTFLIKEETIERRDQLTLEVRQAVKRLPTDQQEAISIFFNRNPPSNIKQVCRDIGIPYSTVRSRMLRGIDGIRRQLRIRGIDGFEEFQNEV